MKIDKLKMLGLTASLLNIAATVVSEHVKSKNINKKISDEVAKALSKR